MDDTRILVAIDDSSASSRAVDYVARLVGRRRGFCLCLVHLLPPLPPALLEHGGSENPQKEAQLEAGLRAEQELWISGAKKAAQESLNKASSTFRNAGYEPELCKPYSANQQMAVPSQKTFFEWHENLSAERSLQVVSPFPGFTSFLARTWRKNSLGMARGSRFGSSSNGPSTTLLALLPW